MNELKPSSQSLLASALASAAPELLDKVEGGLAALDEADKRCVEAVLLEAIEDEVRTGGSRDHGAKLDSLLLEWRRLIDPRAYR